MRLFYVFTFCYVGIFLFVIVNRFETNRLLAHLLMFLLLGVTAAAVLQELKLDAHSRLTGRWKSYSTITFHTQAMKVHPFTPMAIDASSGRRGSNFKVPIICRRSELSLACSLQSAGISLRSPLQVLPL